ncbi:MAG: cytochrome c [Elusimicrobia bacterium]|nr:cytochrome c [Elusimicrobiota bacterium]
MKCFIAFSIALILAAPASAEPKEHLVFQRSSKTVATLSAAQISAKVPPQTVKFYDPHAGKKKAYRCWPIKAVMDLAFGAGWEKSDYPTATLTALDGYASVADALKLSEAGGCLAFEDDEVPGWEPMGRKGANPGPYYLVWTSPEQSTENAYPWPWQLASVNLEKFEARYPEVVPSGAPEGSSAMRGFKIFKNRCLRCHSINQQGGKIGPDLNAPQSIAVYRTKDWVMSYVRQPSKVRYTEMPDHTDLKDSELADIWEYFKLKSKQPEKKTF